jgi:hypothetical protein
MFFGNITVCMNLKLRLERGAFLACYERRFLARKEPLFLLKLKNKRVCDIAKDTMFASRERSALKSLV